MANSAAAEANSVGTPTADPSAITKNEVIAAQAYSGQPMPEKAVLTENKAHVLREVKIQNKTPSQAIRFTFMT